MSVAPPFDSREMYIALTGTDKPPAAKPFMPKFYVLKTIPSQNRVIVGMSDGEVSLITMDALAEMIGVNACQIVNAHTANTDIVHLYRRPPIDLTPPEDDEIPRPEISRGEIYQLKLRLYADAWGRNVFYAAIDHYTKEWWVKI